jgi:hypothetical protein
LRLWYTTTSGTLKITKATASLTLGDLNPTYNGEGKAATVATEPDGIASYVAFTYDGGTALPTDAGEYAVVATLDHPNYTGTTSGTMTISPASITVTADAKSKTYGEIDPDLTFTVTKGELAGDEELVGNLSRVTGENVGPHAITAGDLLASNGNYAITFEEGNLQITPRAVTVTADSLTKTYGDKDPELSYKHDDVLVGEDNFTGILVRVEGENTGTYAIRQGTLTLGSNYDLKFVDAKLTINARPITVTADAQSKTFGKADPALTYKVTSGNLVNGDTFTGSLGRTTGEGVGSFDITQGSLSLGKNYGLTFVGAKLTINAAVLRVDGFRQPIDMGGVVNSTKGGSTVPIKFQIFDGTTEIKDASRIKVVVTSVSCSTGNVTEDVIEQTATGGTSLRYDTTGGQFIYNWQSPKKAGACYQVTVAPTGTNDVIPTSPVAIIKTK